MYSNTCNIINSKYYNTNNQKNTNIIEFQCQEIYNKRQTTWEYFRLS